jgi:hypothetical protein
MEQKSLFVFFIGLLSFAFLVACGPSQAEIDATSTQMAGDIFSTQTAQVPTATKTPTPSPTPTNTPTPIATFIPIQTSTPPTTIPTAALNYSFSLDREIVDVIWNEDGSLSLVYEFTFSNYTFGPPIEFVDVYIPSQNYSLQDISADVDGQAVNHIAESTYVSSAVELGLERNAIPPGETGRVSVRIDQIREVLYSEPTDDRDVNAIFFPTWFDSIFTHGTTDLTVIFHLPLGVQPGESRWHQAPPNWPAEPITGVSEQGQITYTWHNPKAEGYTQYLFGVSFPRIYIPESAIMLPSQLNPLVAKAYFNRGLANALASQFDLALVDLSRGIEIDATDAFAYFLRGAVYAEIGEQESAISDLEKALELGLPTEQQEEAEELLDELSK